MASNHPAVFSIHTTIGTTVLNGSGTLLAGGKYVLTAAHLVDGITNPSQVRVSSKDTVLPNVAAVYQYPGWDKSDTSFNHDIAIIELATPVTSIQGLEIYRSDDYIGQEFTRVGHSTNHTELHVGTNIYDANGEVFNSAYGRNIESGTQILYDYDNGTDAQNALRFLSDSTATPTANETIANSGDSGGPALINNQIAGIASYVAAFSTFDVNDVADFSPGEIAADTRVSYYQDWIDYVTKGNTIYPEPASREDVQKTVIEPDYGTVSNYFLLSTNLELTETVRLWYETMDGSAVAGQDYQQTSGWVELTPSKSSTTIAVSIIGDKVAESAESFYLKVTDPTDTWLGPNVSLIAEHYITDTDLVS